MNEINLFGEKQKYPPSEKEVVLSNLKAKIKKMILDNEDYDFFANLHEAQPPTVNEFIDKQIEHLVKLHNKCKNNNIKAIKEIITDWSDITVEITKVITTK